VISRFTHPQDFERNKNACKLMSELSGEKLEAFANPNPEFQDHYYLGLQTTGFPVGESDTTELMDFLSSKTVLRNYHRVDGNRPAPPGIPVGIEPHVSWKRKVLEELNRFCALATDLTLCINLTQTHD
jgi:hypothetical protein